MYYTISYDHKFEYYIIWYVYDYPDNLNIMVCIFGHIGNTNFRMEWMNF